MFRLTPLALVLVTGLALAVAVPLFPPLRETPLEIDPRQETISYRLPNDTFPIHYKLHLNTRIDNADFAFTGSVEINLGVAVQTQQIVIHSSQSSINGVTLYRSDTLPAVEIAIEPFEKVDATEFLIVKTVSEQLLPTGTYTLVIYFSSVLREDESGFYRAWYTAADGTTRYLATTQFESTDARHAFPCYDEPQKKATFDISISHGIQYSAVSNMPVKNIIPVDENVVVTTVFETTIKMSTYLLAFVVSDYAYLEDATVEPKQRVYSQPPKIEDSRYALQAGVAIMKGLEDYLNVPYSISKMDQFGIPQFAAGAMENWGLVTYREPYFHWNAQTYRTSDQLNVASIIAHEYAHQWFGNLVSPKWWTYLWLNEGFATLYESEAVHFAYPEMRYDELFTIYNVQTVFGVDSADTTRPMTHYAESPNGISNLFDRVAYPKSGSVLRMIKNFITEPVWKQGLENYLTEMAFQAAEPEDLFRGLQTAVTAASISLPTDLKTILDTWTTRRGYPLVTAHREYSADGAIHIEQSRFMDATHEDPAGITYYIPVNIASKGKQNFDVTTADFWFDGAMTHHMPAAADIVPNDNWLLLNKKQGYYYRVNYDDDNWLLLAEELTDGNMNNIHLLNRAQLLDDALDLARFDHLDYTVALHIVKYLKKEMDYVAWRAADPGLTELYRLMRDSDESKYFNSFIAEISEPLYKSLGPVRRTTDDHLTRLNRPLAMKWACRSGVAACLDDTLAALTTAIDTGATLDPDLESAIYCHGMRKAGKELFTKFLGQAVSSASATVRSNILNGLGCNEDESVLEEALLMAIANADNFLTVGEQRTFINAVFANSAVGFHTVLHLVSRDATADQVKAIYGTTYATFLNNMAQYATTDHFLEDFETTLAKYDDITASSKTTILNRIKANLEFVAKNGKEVTNFLVAYYEGGAASIVASVATVLIAAITSYSLF